ncbi:MAG: NAD-binding protein [Candidatus Cloacimonetes bacterium]|nr:NAD-binding protein [Candidatus Cloacimonadota bacterium]
MKKFIRRKTLVFRKNKNTLLLLKNLFFIILIIMAGAVGVLFFEYQTGGIKNLFDAIWWSLVTITTVGYGDLYPITFWGRIIGIVFILLGFIVFSTFTAFIASNFIDKKIKERKGLNTIKDRNHIMICGWNNSARKILDFTKKYEDLRNIKVVLVNELDEGDISSVQNNYPDLEIGFIKGDITNLDVLLKGNITEAKHIILLYDESKPQSAPSDERTIIAAHNLYDLNLKGMINIQLKDKKYLPNIQRTKVQNVVIFDDVGGNLLANATLNPSVPDFVQEALKLKDNKGFREIDIPDEFIGKNYGELFNHFKENKNLVLLGISSSLPEFSISSILSDDTSSIDRFIKRQFELSGKKMEVRESQTRIKIKPEDSYLIQDTDKAIVL